MNGNPPNGGGNAHISTGPDGQPSLNLPPIGGVNSPGIPGAPGDPMAALLNAAAQGKATPGAVHAAVQQVAEVGAEIDPMTLFGQVGRLIIEQLYGKRGLGCSLAMATDATADEHGRIVHVGWVVNLTLPDGQVVVYDDLGVDDLGVGVDTALSEAPQYLEQMQQQRRRPQGRLADSGRDDDRNKRPGADNPRFGALRRR